MADVNLPGGVKLSPKVLGLVVVGGLGAGLLWRRFGGGGGSSAAVALPGSLSTGVENLGFDTVGTDAGSNRRDVQGNGITLPVTKWVVTVGGVDYLTDGETLTPIGGTQPVTNRPPSSSLQDIRRDIGDGLRESDGQTGSNTGEIPNIVTPPPPAVILNQYGAPWMDFDEQRRRYGDSVYLYNPDGSTVQQ